MKICFLGGTRYSQPLDATAEKKFRLLKPLGELFVIGFSKDRWPRQFAQHAHFYLLPQLPVPVLRYALMFTLGPLLALWLILMKGVGILVAQSPYEGFAAVIAKRVAGRLGHKVVLIVENHGDFEEGLFLQRRVLFPGLYRWLMRQTACYTFKHADVLRAVSNSTRERLEAWAPGKPLFQFMTWTDIDVFLESSEHPIAVNGSTVVYAGVLIPRKGVHHLIEAFARIAPHFPLARLFVIGRPDNKGYAEELMAQVKQENLNGRVVFVGEVSQRELAQYIRQARVFVLPTLSEGLPRVLVEAMACRRPVIGSAVSGIPEVVQDGVTGFLVPPGDVDALAERLRWVLEHSKEAEAMGQRAQAFARRFFSAEAYVRGYAELLETAHQERIAESRR